MEDQSGRGRVTRNNHYVPQWYQRRFLRPGQPNFIYLDLHPEERVLDDGRVIAPKPGSWRAPSRCFCVQDLYTTFLGRLVNDGVERFLFGAIDAKGARALRAFAGGDPRAMHEAFQDFFEFLDAQKLRTPKGLDWIRARYARPDQVELMVEMQGLRFMHCAMWMEGVREIVSAADSDVKFIVTDHPVTAYNAALPPSFEECAYPEDPAVEFVGTQTIFALDPDTCLILTHLEYAQAPSSSNPLLPRTYARFRGQSLVRPDACIRKRRLSRDEVFAVNLVLKSRARRFIAAPVEEWLYPEMSFAREWADIAQVLLPRDELWRFGGEIYVGYKDGSVHYQDPYGRTSGSHEYLRRTERKVDLGPDDPCGCGSGDAFKDCCRELREAERPTWDVFGIRERNLMFCHAVKRTLGLDSGKTWDDVRRELSDDQVKGIHQDLASLWPEDTDLPALLPRPKARALRGLYLGPTDPRTIDAVVLGWLMYFDEIVVANPFMNPTGTNPDYSPTLSPTQFKTQTLKNVALLLRLEPFIEAGYVHLIPNPGDFNRHFGISVLHMARTRTAHWKQSAESCARMKALAMDDARRQLESLPPEALRHLIRESDPNLTAEEVESTIVHFKNELADDPYALLQSIEPGEKAGQLVGFKGYNLESGMFLAALTGSFIYTDDDAHWEQLHLFARRESAAASVDWSPVVDALQRMEFPVCVDPRTIFDSRCSGQYSRLRAALRSFDGAVRSAMPGTLVAAVTGDLAAAALEMAQEWQTKAVGDSFKGRVAVAIPVEGFARNEVQRLLLTFGRTKAVLPIPHAMRIAVQARDG